MRITHWEEIRKLREEIKNGNYKILVEFLEFLIKNKVNLRDQLLTDICESTVSSREEAWSLLHDFAYNHYHKEEK